MHLVLLYYILGLITYEVQDPELVGTIFMGVYFLSLLSFIVLAVIIYAKMKTI